MNILVTIWMLAYIGGGGEIRQVADYRTRPACEQAMAEGMAKGLAVRCMQTSQLVPKSYYDGLR
jgi:hypothetical protein